MICKTIKRKHTCLKKVLDFSPMKINCTWFCKVENWVGEKGGEI